MKQSIRQLIISFLVFISVIMAIILFAPLIIFLAVILLIAGFVIRRNIIKKYGFIIKTKDNNSKKGRVIDQE